MRSAYDDTVAISQAIADGRHREIIGAMWDEIGALQFDFLVARGLQPNSHLLDIGCGCLRGGVRFARYLEPGHYFGVDRFQELLDAGIAELAAIGLHDRVPRTLAAAAPCPRRNVTVCHKESARRGKGIPNNQQSPG